ncbi:hypothetical protein CLUG_01428 [Clavispora lusitaniae ATCC 42720]|uniref:Uncharacterized protein n=1 Tax=Clavispora lusitaniae (strain ATCC 42720) TaxID=306902 RepID=C4XZP6_CLAL4|nr:uncharacterized protein CLUG_01428 [Clavispora lusitaniae ATCC 42720]EEQ37305.1 hypothetical protein CLUG_01428 [Clavispora lusitaniae ATCC 42720]
MISVNSTSINPTHVTGLLHTLSSASSILATAHKNGPVYTYSQYLRGASASLNAISAESVLATATASSAKASASAALRSAALDLAGLEWEQNQYTEWLTLWPERVVYWRFWFPSRLPFWFDYLFTISVLWYYICHWHWIMFWWLLGAFSFRQPRERAEPFPRSNYCSYYSARISNGWSLLYIRKNVGTTWARLFNSSPQMVFLHFRFM